MKYGKMRNDVFPIGTRFNRLVVVEVILPETGPINVSTIKYRCKCDCGNEKIARHGDLRRGMTQSCGCLQREIVQKIRTTHGDTPGGNHNRLYDVWWSMNERCKYPSQRYWKSYGGRGIKVCDEWKSPHGYVNFKTWAYNNGYHDQPADTPRIDLLTIDRMHPNGDYCPSNCRWIPMWMQFANQRSAHLYSVNGEVLHTAEVERKYGVKSSIISDRVNYQGWSDDAVSLSIECPELGLHKDKRRNYRDKDGFYVLIRKRPEIYSDPRYDPSSRRRKRQNRD